MAKKKSAEKQGTPAPPRSQDIVFELYTDNQEHMKCLAMLQNQEDIDFWAIWHDSDTYTNKDLGEYLMKHDEMPSWSVGDTKKKHCHVCLHFRNARYVHAVGYELGLHKEDKHLFEKCNDMHKYTHYLWHDPEFWPEKHTYAPGDIFGNKTGMIRALDFLNRPVVVIDGSQYQKIMEYIDYEKNLSQAKFTKWIISNGLIEFFEKHSRILQPYLKEALDHRRMLYEGRPFESFGSVDEFLEWKKENEA